MFVVQRPRAVRNRRSVLIEQHQRVDELALAFGATPDLLRPLDLLLRSRNCRGQNGRLPELVKIRHRHSPMCHRTLWIMLGYTLKCIFGSRVSERVKQSHASVELLLNGRLARNRKRHLSQFLRCAMVVCLLCQREGRKRNDQQKNPQHSPSIGHTLAP